MSRNTSGGMKRAPRGRVNDDTLLNWLDNQPERLEKYLATHPDAADRLDQMTTLSPEVGLQLSVAVAPTADFSARMVEGLRADPSAGQAASIVFGLFALPWRTASFLVDPDRGTIDTGAEGPGK
jgi:hypothetical protein